MDFETKGHKYRINRLTAKEQFHIARKIIKGGDKEFLDILADMSDEDSERLIFGLLKPVLRFNPESSTYTPVSKDRELLYADMEYPEMIELVGKSLQRNIGDFL